MYPVLTLYVESVTNGYINVSSSHPVRGVGFERVDHFGVVAQLADEALQGAQGAVVHVAGREPHYLAQRPRQLAARNLQEVLK